ncbi:MAG: chloride channel protein [Bacteroidetes bacterium HGW-Bacteroidetes-17]|jgi:CIC family chloride channel protein|nr:MAG: chloride channel protein [Bacteroidetes bacterium HGW-Bacteroidetes-17]
MTKYKVLKRFLTWRLRHINDRQFILITSVLVGFLASIAVIIIKKSASYISSFLTSNFANEYENYLYLAFPMIGILIVVFFVRHFIRQDIGHGVAGVLYAISKNNGIIKRHNMFSSIIAGTITVGFGGSVGLEAPTVATGAAIGSNIGRLFHLNYKQIILLIGVATAAAIAAIFKSPIAAIVFALEVLMLDLTMASALPLLVASVTAVISSYFFLGQAVLYPFEIRETFLLKNTIFYIIFGILSGVISVYFTKVHIFIERLFVKVKHWYVKLLIGGSILGILIFFFPSLYGEGYDSINASLQGDINFLYDKSIFYSLKDNMAVIFLLFLMIILLKVVASSVTFGAGGIGGIFAPTLFIGSIAGLFFAKLVNYFGLGVLPEGNFALVGMAGLIAGVLHGPLFAIFLIAEITGGYHLIVPLMITATISYGTIKIFLSHSVYTHELARKGQLFTHHKDKAVLSLMRVDKLIERDFKSIGREGTLGDLVKIIVTSQRNIFPVVDGDNNFSGIIRLDDIRHIMFKSELYDEVKVSTLMIVPEYTIDPDESMEEVARKFQESGKFNLVVIKDGKYYGFISRAKVFSKYRLLLKYFSDD